MNTAMSPENFQAEIDRITNTFSSEIERHYARWDCWYQVYLDHAFGIIPHFAAARDAYVRQSVLDYYAFPNAPRLRFEVFPPGAGSLLINTITPELPFSGYYFNGNAIDLTLQPTDGFVFDHWGYSEDAETSSAAHWKHSFQRDGKVIAYFKPASGELSVYPNPATNALTIGLDARAAGQVDVRGLMAHTRPRTGALRTGCFRRRQWRFGGHQRAERWSLCDHIGHEWGATDRAVREVVGAERGIPHAEAQRTRRFCRETGRNTSRRGAENAEVLRRDWKKYLTQRRRERREFQKRMRTYASDLHHFSSKDHALILCVLCAGACPDEGGT